MDLYRYMSMDEFRCYREGLCNDLSYVDCLYLNIILLSEDCTPSDISYQLNIARSSVTVRLNKLESGGWISRIRDGDDRRSYRLSLTDKGKAEFEPIWSMFRLFESKIRERYTDEEIGLFCRIVDTALEDSPPSEGDTSG